MREILFRGKRTDNGEWVYGYLLKGKLAYIVTDADMEYMVVSLACTACMELVEVIPETVGQFTGMYDMNGENIFEDDIVIHHNDNPFVKRKEKGCVFWDENSLRWRRTTNHVTHLGKVDSYILSSSCVYEVIGNIHDNPELLKGEE